MTRLSTSAARKGLTKALDLVARKGERILLERRGKSVAAIVSVEDLAWLEETEDRLDAEEAEKRLADIKAGRAKTIPWEQVKRQLKGCG